MDFYEIAKNAGAKSVKRVSTDPDAGFLVIQFDGDYSYDEDQLQRIWTKVEKVSGMKCLVLPPGARVRAVPNKGAAYQRERIGDYEYELLAKDEESLAARLKVIQGNKWS